VSAHYVTTGTELVSRFVESSVNDVLLQTNPDFTSHFLNLSTFCKSHLVNTVLHDSQAV